MMRIFTVNENIKKLAAWVLLVVVVLLLAVVLLLVVVQVLVLVLVLVPWTDVMPTVLAVPASIATVLALRRIFQEAKAARLEAPAVRAQPQQAGAMKLAAVALLLVVLYVVAHELDLVSRPWAYVLAVPVYAVVLYAASLELIPWTWPAGLAVVMAAAVWRARRWHLIDDDPQLPVDPAYKRRSILVVAVIVVAVWWIVVNIQIVGSTTRIYD